MKYQKPKMEIVKFEAEDVVRTSGFHDPDKPNDVNDTDNIWP